MSSGSRRNSSKPNVPSGRLKMSTQRSTAEVEGLAKTDQDGSKRADMVSCYGDRRVAGARVGTARCGLAVQCHRAGMSRLPDILKGEGLELRRWDPAFAEPMIEAIRRSIAELQQWMSWAQAMPTLHELRRVLVRGQMDFDADLAREYSIFETESEQLVGGAGLHPSDRPDRYEIGYWVRSDHTGRGFATTATTTLVDAAFTHLGEGTQIAIRMDRANRASAAVPRKLGFSLDHQEDRDVLAKGHTGRGLGWIRDRTR